MLAPRSIQDVVAGADLIVVGRPVAARDWPDAPYVIPDEQSLIHVEISKVLKGEALLNASPSLDIYISSSVPPGTVADLDHLLFLNVLPADGRVYFLGNTYFDIYGNVGGDVIVPEHGSIKHALGSDLFTIRLDGTAFRDLVRDVENLVASDGATRSNIARELIARGGYFAC